MNKGSKFPVKRIAAFVPNILKTSPGQRVRIEFWESFLKDAGWDVDYYNFENDLLHEILYLQGRSLTKLKRLTECYRNHLSQIFSKINADIVFIYREASLVGPALSERVIARKKIPIVYDIDDPVFIQYRSPVNGWASLLKFPKKTHTLFRLSTHIIAINDLIGDYAAKFNPNVSVIPNCVNTDIYKPSKHKETSRKNVKMVWIGSHSTMQNLMEIAEPIRHLQKNHKCPLLIIGSSDSANLENIDTEVRQWTAESEVRDLQEGDIGLLPVNDLEWNHWKFFYKTIQYMAIGIPVVARNIGSNSRVIQDGVTGFIVENNRQWLEKLTLLVENPDLRKEMGRAARQSVIENYSVKSQMPKMVQIFDSVLESKKV